MFLKYVFRLATLTMMSGFVCAGFADDQSQGEKCYKDQYVLTVSSIEALKDKTVDEVDSAIPGGIEVLDESKRALLIDSSPTNDSQDGKKVSYDSSKDLCLKIRSEQRAERLEAREAGVPSIVRRISCSCNGEVRLNATTPNDPYYGLEWGLPYINADKAWDISTGSNNVIVAVIDTGVDYNNEDLVANMWVNPNEIAGNGIDDDHNGYIDDIHGINAINNSGNPMDDHFHGTHVAGTIAGVGNNGKGIVGVVHRAKIVGAKFISSSGSGSIYDAIKAIDYVTSLKSAGHNVVLSNNSWGGQGGFQPLYDSIARALNAGILFVAAAGNSSADVDSTPFTPAMYSTSLRNVISVAAIDINGNMASFSNYGRNTVQVGAPGVNIASTYPGNQYYYLSGTSMAAPHVSGALALLSSANWMLTMDDLKSYLLANGRSLPSLNNKTVTGKVIDVDAAVRAVPPPGPTNTPTPTRTPTPTFTPTMTPTPTNTPTITPTPNGFCVVQGKISNGSSNVEGAQVSVVTFSGTQVTYSDANGNYRFSAVRCPAAYTLKVSASGLTYQDQTGYASSDIVVNFTSATVKSYTINGIVYDSSKSALPGVLINLSGFGQATTDQYGKFSFSSIPYNTNYTLSATLDGYLSEGDLHGTIEGAVSRVFVLTPE